MQCDMEPPRRVLVIGGRGHFGAAVLGALRSAGFAVQSGGRDGRNDTHVDLAAPDSFAAFDGFEAIVNCADGSLASPLPAAQHCLRHGGVFVETSANLPVVDTLLRLREESGDGPGLVVVSLGIFPGLSDLMLGANAQGTAKVPVLSIMLDVLSGAGRGMVRLMVGMLGQGERAQAGVMAPHSGGPRRGAPLPFAEQRLSKGPQVPLTQLVAGPGATWLLRLMDHLLRRSGALSPYVRALCVGMFHLGRGLLLKQRRTRLELVACDAGTGGYLRYSTLDGLRSGGFVVAAALELLLRATPRPAGVVTPAEVLHLDSVLASMSSLGDPGGFTRG